MTDLLRRTDPELASGGPPHAAASRPRIGFALGAGAARGWAHIGALHELAAMGVVPDVIAGSSIGALVGGCFAAGRLDELEAFARSLNKRRVFGLLDFSFSGAGLIGGGKLRLRLQETIGALLIEDLPMRKTFISFGATHGMSPSQNSTRAFDGVPPLTTSPTSESGIESCSSSNRS